MDVLQTILLGLIQGLTEFIPISSSGHLVVAQTFFSGFSNHLFLEWINIGTMLALLVYFRKRIVGIVRECVAKRDFRFVRNILLTALPAGIVGYAAAEFIDQAPLFGSIITVTITLFTVGVLMIVLERLPKASEVSNLSDFTWTRAIGVGIVQVFALIPGVSRSGSTIIAGRLLGLSPALAAEYSFLASLPIMMGVTLKLVASAGDRAYFVEHAGMLVLSNSVAFVSGLLAVGFLMRYLAKHSLSIFGWYRVGLAGVLAVILLVQSMK